MTGSGQLKPSLDDIRIGFAANLGKQNPLDEHVRRVKPDFQIEWAAIPQQPKSGSLQSPFSSRALLRGKMYWDVTRVPRQSATKSKAHIAFSVFYGIL